MATLQQKIIPHLWFDNTAKAAAGFYASVFPDAAVTDIMTLHDTPAGDCDVVSFVLWGHRFVAFSAGPLFKFNPSVSFIVNFDPLFFKPSPSPEKDARRKLDAVWENLSEDGTVLMPIDEYPFSRRYGWIQDRYGLSWQVMLTCPDGDPRPPIVPNLLFVGKNCGNAEAAMRFYLSVFRHSRSGNLVRYGPGQAPDEPGTIMFADFMLEGSWFAAMDSAREHRFGFNEAVSFMVSCRDQEEIDYYWERLSAVPEAEQCGWLKDRYGISWQIVPAALDEMLRNGTAAQKARVTQAFLKMKKFDLAELERAYA